MTFLRNNGVVNIPMLIRVMGLLAIVESVFMILPVIVSLAYREDDAKSFAIAALFTLVSGVLMTVGARPKRFQMGKREGFLLTALVWVLFSFFGMIPFLLIRKECGISESFFESMSGFTTTGVTVFEDVESLSHGLHLWRALMQWIGGMGIILFTLAVIPMLNSSGGMQMFNAEVTGITREKLRPRVSSTAKRLWLVYGLLTITLFVLYWLGPMDVFDSICHAFTTMSTGGFSTKSAAIEAWNDTLYVKIVTTVFMFIGGVNFALIFKASTGDFKSVWINQTFKTFVAVIIVLSVVLAIVLMMNPQIPNTFENIVVNPVFQIVSVMSSTSYAVTGLENWGNFIFILIVILMFFGACAGSTSGGAKIDRAIFLLKNSRNEINRCIHPNRILPIRINGKTVSPELLNKVLAFLGLYMLLIVAGALFLSSFGVEIIDCLGSSLACISNAGIYLPADGFGLNYAQLPPPALWGCAFLMLTGRLEIFTVLVLLMPGFWKK